MRWMNDNWKGLLRDIMKNKSKMDKNEFINQVVNRAGTGQEYEDNTTMIPDAVGNLVERPAVAQRKARKQAEYDEIAQRGQSQKEAYEKQQAEANDRANEFYGKIQAGRDESQRQIQIQQRRNQAANKIIKKFRNRETSGSVASAPVSVGLAGGSPAPGSSAPIHAGNSQAAAIASAPVSASSPATSPLPKTNLFSGVLPSLGSSSSTKIPSPSKSEKTQYKTELGQINTILNTFSTNKDSAGLEAFLENKYGKSFVEDWKQELKSNKKRFTMDSLRSLAYHLAVNELRSNTTPFILSENMMPVPPSQGSGFRTAKRVIRGRGYTKHQRPTKKPKRHYINERYYVDMNKLEDGILVLKYASNDSSVPHLKTTQITQKAKEIIEDILNDKFDERIYKLLTNEDKRLVRRFINQHN